VHPIFETVHDTFKDRDARLRSHPPASSINQMKDICDATLYIAGEPADYRYMDVTL